ncbi:60S ribosomal protein L14, variant 2 [Clonorchis sinensis]|uniref:60S ribosomal protein L14 n=2 Tax=Clonorchis sinensis TaxID=79923 RepID=A0A8T1M174_CLOSI|nr:60S ribosomal protein L14 [Clonorchis sinensis]KAG5442587.1 60S ribosomal protein L14, variant 2 [Clonorchis sinensis]GAA52769.1 large subunit ribosomal protein L14e [Clonorchis sinensis]
MVSFRRFVEAGRVVFIADGPHAKKVALIVEIIDQNRVLIDGPCTGVPRQGIGLKKLHLTKIRCKLPHGCGTAAVKKIWEKNNLTEEWKKTSWARKLERKALRAKMSDFDRFKVMVARQQRNRILKSFRIRRPEGAPKIVKKVAKSK